LEIDLVSSEDGTQTGMVEMIMVINLPKITKSESISMLVYQKLVYQSNIERTLKLVTVTITTARPGIIIGKGGQEVDKLKEELKKITDKEVQINIFEIKRPELDAYLVATSICRQIESRFLTDVQSKWLLLLLCV
jgi:ribosomal protein S3